MMNTITNFFSNDWADALGWTLLHSIWQSMVILLIVVACLRFIPLILSRVRYAVTCAGIFLTLLSSLFTFTYLINQTSSAVSIPGSTKYSVEFAIHNDVSLSAVEQTFSHLAALIESNMPLILLCWIVGSILFSLRMISGWLYISRLKAESVVVNDQWSEKLQSLAHQLGIDRLVTLAQSARIYSPIVIGFLRPVVLVPVGMLSGLSPEQIETIFIHELAHIRRHDFIINLIQSFIEALFFFNPFVWIISNLIRREREYCCDDTVITKHGSAMAYAYALTQLEEVRLARSSFALSLAENKNQLLNRIKRIMEKSGKNYSGRERMIPAVLFVIGLICASWLTIKADGKVDQDRGKEGEKIAADTLGKKNQKSARYSKKVITTFDEKGEPHEEIVEDFEGDEEQRPLIPDLSFDFPMPEFPVGPSDFPEPLALPDFPGVPDLDEMMKPFGSFRFDEDTIPGNHFGYRSDRDWEEFSKEFEKKFREQFGDFYNSHEKDFEKMMKDLEETFAKRSKQDDFGNLQDHARALADQARMLAEIERSQHDIFRDATKNAREAEEQARKQMEEWHENQQEDFEKLEHERILQTDQLREMENRLRDMEIDMRSFNKELKESLVKDGYINKNEEITNMNWDDDGEIVVNGKRIKGSDRKKYQELHRKYFKEGRHFRLVE